MKKTLLISFIALTLSQCIESSAQITVSSTTGYIVDINVRPIAVLPASLSCQWGYNYNVKLSYQVFITGPNKPSSLYTLQGTIGCSNTTSFFDLPNNGGAGVTTAANAWRPAGDCNVITPSLLGCNTVNIQIEGPGISSRTVSYPMTYTPLPVTLEEFSVKENDDLVKLSWTTASEFNSDHFVVQRLIKENEWSDLAKISAARNSSDRRVYDYTDSFSVYGAAYYRLKQVNKDGNFSFSKTVSIMMRHNGPAITVYPVPNRDNKIHVQGIAEYKNIEMTLTDINGSKLYSIARLSPEMILPQLKTGTYLLRFVNRETGGSAVIRYLKL